MFTRPVAPNLPDYLAFLYGSVGIELGFLPSASGTATGGDTTSLVDSTQAWTNDQWIQPPGYVVADITQNVTGAVVTNTVSRLTFAPALSSPVTSGDQYVIVPGVVSMSLDIALEIVNQTINSASQRMYTLAVYNLATDRLINYADDVPNQTFFEDKRAALRILDPPSGVVSSGSDEGTAANILNPEQAKLFTLQDLQTLKTPWGRRYMEIAQSFGRSIWGLT